MGQVQSSKLLNTVIINDLTCHEAFNLSLVDPLALNWLPKTQY